MDPLMNSLSRLPSFFQHTFYTLPETGQRRPLDVFQTTFSILLFSEKGNRYLTFCITSIAPSAGLNSGSALRPIRFSIKLLIPDDSISIHIKPGLVLPEMLPRSSFFSYNERIAQSIKIGVH